MLEVACNVSGNLSHTFGAYLLLGGAEVHISLAVEGDEVDVGVRHLESEDGDADLDAAEGAAHSRGNALGKQLERQVILVAEIKEVVDLLLGDYQHVTLGNGVDVEESIVVLVFGDLVRGDFAGNDARKNRCHGELERDFNDFKFHHTGGRLNLDDLAHLVPEETLSDGGRGCDFLLAEVSLRVGDDGVFHHSVVG